MNTQTLYIPCLTERSAVTALLSRLTNCCLKFECSWAFSGKFACALLEILTLCTNASFHRPFRQCRSRFANNKNRTYFSYPWSRCGHKGYVWIASKAVAKFMQFEKYDGDRARCITFLCGDAQCINHVIFKMGSSYSAIVCTCHYEASSPIPDPLRNIFYDIIFKITVPVYLSYCVW